MPALLTVCLAVFNEVRVVQIWVLQPVLVTSPSLEGEYLYKIQIYEWHMQ